MNKLSKNRCCLLLALLVLCAGSAYGGGKRILRCVESNGRIAEYGMYCPLELRAEETHIINALARSAEGGGAAYVTRVVDKTGASAGGSGVAVIESSSSNGSACGDCGTPNGVVHFRRAR